MMSVLLPLSSVVPLLSCFFHVIARACCHMSIQHFVKLTCAQNKEVGNPCWLVDPRRLKGTSFPTHLDGGRSHESDAPAVHDGAGKFDHADRSRAGLVQTASSE